MVERLEWISNAPVDWPRPFCGRLPKPECGQRDPINLFWFIGVLQEAYKREGWADMPEFKALQSRLVTYGVVRFPLCLLVNGKSHPIFFYDHEDQSAGQHFASAQQILRDVGDAEPIYYSSGRLQGSRPAHSVEPFTLRDIQLDNDPPSPGHYAMWWGDLTSDLELESITRSYRALDGIESYFLGFLIYSLTASKGNENFQPVSLPLETDRLLLRGPEDVSFFMSFNAEKGVRLHFRVASTSPIYRDLFWTHFAILAEEFRSQLLGSGLPINRVQGDHGTPLEWWTLCAGGTKKRVEECVHRGDIDKSEVNLGVLLIAPGERGHSFDIGTSKVSLPCAKQQLLSQLPADEQATLILAPLAVTTGILWALDGNSERLSRALQEWADNAKKRSRLTDAVVGELIPNLNVATKLFVEKCEPVTSLVSTAVLLRKPELSSEAEGFKRDLVELTVNLADACSGVFDFLRFGKRAKTERAVNLILQALTAGED